MTPVSRFAIPSFIEKATNFCVADMRSRVRKEDPDRASAMP